MTEDNYGMFTWLTISNLAIYLPIPTPHWLPLSDTFSDPLKNRFYSEIASQCFALYSYDIFPVFAPLKWLSIAVIVKYWVKSFVLRWVPISGKFSFPLLSDIYLLWGGGLWGCVIREVGVAGCSCSTAHLGCLNSKPHPTHPLSSAFAWG